jgi:dTDP-4-dehydrorhamnose reductase
MRESVLIVGGDSKVGKSLGKYLANKNYDVYRTSRNINKYSHKNNIFEIDLENDKTFNVLKNEKFDYIVFCAGISSITNCHDNPELAEKVNVINTVKLISIIAKNCNKLIYLSSSQVFSKLNPQNIGDYTNPITVYGRYKLDVEDFIKNYELKNIYIIRLSKVFFKNDQLFSTWNWKIEKNLKIDVCNNLFLSPISEEQINEKICLLFNSIIVSRVVHLSATDKITYADLCRFYLKNRNANLNLLSIQVCKEDIRLGIRPNLSSILLEPDFRFKLNNSFENIKSLVS